VPSSSSAVRREYPTTSATTTAVSFRSDRAVGTMRFRLDAEFGTREFGDRFHRAESPQFQFGAQAAVFLKVVAQGETVALAAMPHLAPFRASAEVFFALSRQRADNFAAGIREFERNAFARVPIAELFFLGSWSGCRCTCDFLAALRATLANHPRHCEKNPALLKSTRFRGDRSIEGLSATLIRGIVSSRAVSYGNDTPRSRVPVIIKGICVDCPSMAPPGQSSPASSEISAPVRQSTRNEGVLTRRCWMLKKLRGADEERGMRQQPRIVPTLIGLLPSKTPQSRQ
jgi:hypothetical protein